MKLREEITPMDFGSMEKIRHIAAQFFTVPFEAIQISEIGHGLINNTYLISSGNTNKKYILQKINTAVFKDAEALIQNAANVVVALKQSDYPLEVSSLIATKTGELLHYDVDGHPWRMFTYVEKSISLTKADNPVIAFEAARAFSLFYKTKNGNVHKMQLQPVLPDFINFKKRIADYKGALKNASEERKRNAAAVIEFVAEHISLPDRWIALQSANLLPKRIIHADPKISNVLFHEETHKAIAVIDLDTVMEGTLLYDFGDMIRSYTNITNEDVTSATTTFDPELFVATKKGFLSCLETILEPVEKENLDYAAKVVVFIQAIRFLTDYLKGDTYYHISYENHNLYRTANQINLLKGILDFC
ncbi:phosphotransferase enzyme family protein [Flavobacterium pedocola]